MRASVQPSETAPKDTDFQFPVFQEFLVHRGDFQLTSSRGFDGFGHVHHLVGVEIKPDHRIIALGGFGFLLNADTVALFVELGHTVTFRIADPVAENGRFLILLGIFHCFFQQRGKAAAIKDVVAQHEAHVILADELPPQHKCLRESIGHLLNLVREFHAERGAIPQEAFEVRQILWRGDDQHFSDASQHQR